MAQLRYLSTGLLQNNAPPHCAKNVQYAVFFNFSVSLEVQPKMKKQKRDIFYYMETIA